MAGGSNARTGGGSRSKSSTSTRQVFGAGPARDRPAAPRSGVTTFGLPCRSGQRRADGLDEPNDILGARETFGVELSPLKVLRSGDGISAPRTFLELSPKLVEHMTATSSDLRGRRNGHADAR